MSKLIVNLTHDVDRVFKTYQYFTQDILKGKWNNISTFFSKNSPYWMFDEIMEIENSFDVRSTFFFLEESIPFKLWSLKNWYLSLGRYAFDDVKDVIQELDKEGWEIALHGSYLSYKSLNLLKREKLGLEQILGKDIIGVRQHHLNLNIPNTWCLQKKAGFKYDASYGLDRGVGYKDKNDRPFFDIESELTIIPLTFMEFNVMNLASNNFNMAQEILLEQINKAEENESVLSVLWHQRYFNDKEFPYYKQLYIDFIKECKNRDASFKTCNSIYKEFIS